MTELFVGCWNPSVDDTEALSSCLCNWWRLQRLYNQEPKRALINCHLNRSTVWLMEVTCRWCHWTDVPVFILTDCFLVAPRAACNHCMSEWVANLRNDFGVLSTHKVHSYFLSFAPQPLSVNLISHCDSSFVGSLTAGIKTLHLKETRQRIIASKFAFVCLCVWPLPSAFDWY